MLGVVSSQDKSDRYFSIFDNILFRSLSLPNNIITITKLAGSICLGVIEGDSCPRGCEFESQCHTYTVRIIFTLICCKIVLVFEMAKQI